MGITRRRLMAVVAVAAIGLAGVAGVTVVRRAIAPAVADSYPAAPYMNAYMSYWGAQGKGGAEQICLAALYSTYYYAEYVWGPSVGVSNGAGGALFGVYFNGKVGGRCPGTAFDGVNYHYGLSCMGSPGVSCPEGAGPYVSVGSTSGHNAFVGAEGYTASATVYYVWAHESGHQWAFRTGFASSTNECYGDAFAVAMGARNFFGNCA